MEPVGPHKDPGRYASEYQKVTSSGIKYLEFRDINELVRKYVKGKRTLDYGCGTGESSLFLKSLGLSVTGVDINEGMVKRASENDVDGCYKLIESAKIPVNDNTYDLVFSSWVLVDVSSKSELLKIGKEINRVLKPEGIFIMIVSNKYRYNNDWLSVNTEFEENKSICSGSQTKLLVKQANVILSGYFWTEEDYREMIKFSNMKVLEIHRPLGKDSDGYNWRLEKYLSSIDIYVVQKNV